MSTNTATDMRRISNRDWGRMQQARIAERSIQRILTRQRAEEYRNCVIRGLRAQDALEAAHE